MTRTVITYGTFDYFHEGHRRLLERARALGDYLIVGVTTDAYDAGRGKLNVNQTLLERVDNVRRSGLADEIIIEEYEGQKIHDIQSRGIDIFAIGSDWTSQFDYLKDYCEVVYLERTRGISSTDIRNQLGGMLRIGLVGTGRIARRFVQEARYVAGISIEALWSRTGSRAREFGNELELPAPCQDYSEVLEQVDAVYIATPHGSHSRYAEMALDRGVHVLCEKPLTLTRQRTAELFDLARSQGLVLVEAIKTAFCPGFLRMVAYARSGSIGRIRSVDATFTKLIDSGRERQAPDGGALSELASYPLLAIVKLLGKDYTQVHCQSYWPADSEVDLFSRIDISYPHAIATAKVGIGVKSEGELVVSGTKGYLYVPAPWWLTENFETRFEDPRDNRRFFYRFDGDGLRYELARFATMIREGSTETYHLPASESVTIAGIIEHSRTHAQRFG